MCQPDKSRPLKRCFGVFGEKTEQEAIEAAVQKRKNCFTVVVLRKLKVAFKEQKANCIALTCCKMAKLFYGVNY
jgi:hypothetical protein